MAGPKTWLKFFIDIIFDTVNKHFFASSVTHRSTSRYIVDQFVWQRIEYAISESLYHDTIDIMDKIELYCLRVHQSPMQLFLPH